MEPRHKIRPSNKPLVRNLLFGFEIHGPSIDYLVSHDRKLLDYDCKGALCDASDPGKQCR